MNRHGRGSRVNPHAPSAPLTKLWERHHEIARRLVAGEKIKEVAESMGMTPSRISAIYNSPEFQAHLATLSEAADQTAVDVRQRLQTLSQDAVDTLERVIKRQTAPFNVSLQVRVAETILDRAGYGPIKTINQQGQVDHKVAAEGILKEALESLKRHSAAAAGAAAGAAESFQLLEAPSAASAADRLRQRSESTELVLHNVTLVTEGET